jgi:hypothetical protein
MTEPLPHPLDRPVVISYGGGVNSTALLVGMRERGLTPDLILFSDTGGEFDYTYRTVEKISERCVEWFGMPVVTINNADREGFPHTSLEDECRNNKTLPSLAFGFKGCSTKWKRQPMDRYIKSWEPALEAWERGEKVIRLIGIDAGEAHRSANLETLDDPKFDYRRPLIEWGWARDECIEACVRGFGFTPRRSACWFCPATRKPEVLALAADYPELFERAVAMERRAAPDLGVVKGLGRKWTWERLVKADSAQLKLFPEAPDLACGCFDGEED